MLAIVGQSPATPGDEPFSGMSGMRLARLLGLTLEEMIHTVHLDVWSDESVETMHFPMVVSTVLLCGPSMGKAFGLESEELLEWQLADIDGRGEQLAVAVVPDPSGRNRWWSDAKNRRQAKRFFEGVRQRELVERDPLQELADLGDAVPMRKPEGGGSVRG